MLGKKRAIKSDLKKVDRHRIAAKEYDDAPEVTDVMLARATLYEGDKVIRRGRSPVGDLPKTPTSPRRSS